jgi:hypothetical protein
VVILSFPYISSSAILPPIATQILSSKYCFVYKPDYIDSSSGEKIVTPPEEPLGIIEI